MTDPNSEPPPLPTAAVVEQVASEEKVDPVAVAVAGLCGCYCLGPILLIWGVIIIALVATCFGPESSDTEPEPRGRTSEFRAIGEKS